ncbi:MAG: UDP-N-acetylglucosamine 2-epimerase (non-hydrolyzing) [Flavobacteriia bacterium]|nr:UDP-N-acetylglucosamine 2-epimerase (non-hydrolyzing) [Flavobacteriia bacterium]
MKIISVIGTRPNIIKVAPFLNAIKNLNNQNIVSILVHTGQHYDENLSNNNIKVLEINKIDYSLNIGSDTNANQIAKTILSFDDVLINEKPDWVVVFGDVNATVACAIATKCRGIKLVHVEAGIRSFDNNMQEEMNRILCDSIADVLIAPDEFAVENLIKQGIPQDKIKMLGNIMIDSLDRHIEQAKLMDLYNILHNNKVTETNLNIKNFYLITLHRDTNVDSLEFLKLFIEFLKNHVSRDTFVWIMHPRTQKNLHKFDLWNELLQLKNVCLLNPVSYIEMLALQTKTLGIITDSGGIQEEACVLGIPFLLLRENTERPLTLIKNGGTGILFGTDVSEIQNGFEKLKKSRVTPFRPTFWDGKTAVRIVESLFAHF